MATQTINLVDRNAESNQIENAETLSQQVQMLSKKLEEIKYLAGKEQGRWADFNDQSYSPEWTIPFKKIIHIIEEN